MIRWRRFLWIAIATAIAVVVAALLFRVSREPQYAGRSLSYWVLLYRHGNAGEIREAERAVRAIGTNALPFLLEWITGEQPIWKQKLLQVCCNQKFFRPQFESYALKEFFLSEGATQCFEVLGPAARPALPELKRRLQDPKPEVWGPAMLALGYIGKDGVPILIEVLTNQANTYKVRRFAIDGLDCARTNAAPAIPLLLRCLEDKDRRIASRAVSTLGRISLEPGLVVPALTNCLQSSNFDIRWYSVIALGRFGKEASQAVPALLKILEEPSPAELKSSPRPGMTNIPGAMEISPVQLDLKTEVTNALRKIAPGIL